MTEKWGEIQGIIISTSWRWPRKQQSTANNQLFKERLHLKITRAKPGLLSITHRNHPVAWHFQHFLPFSTSVQALSNLVTQATGTIGNFPGSNENQRQEQQQLPVKLALMQSNVSPVSRQKHRLQHNLSNIKQLVCLPCCLFSPPNKIYA